MKVTIVDSEKVLFGNLKVGDTFKSSEHIYMKTEKISRNAYISNAVLISGTNPLNVMTSFIDNKEVVPVNCELIVQCKR